MVRRYIYNEGAFPPDDTAKGDVLIMEVESVPAAGKDGPVKIVYRRIPAEKDAIALAQIDALKKVVDALPTETVPKAVTDDIKALSDKYAELDKSKAAQADLDAAETAITALRDALADLPTAGVASSEQLALVDGRVKALEDALDKIAALDYSARLAAVEAALPIKSLDRVESISLGTLQPETWTSFPTATGTIKDSKIFDSAGNDISSLLETRRTASGWEVFSLVRQDNLIFEYEINPAGDSKIEKFVLPLLPANTWTSLPVATGVIADYKIFDSDFDISGLLDIRRVNGAYQAYSLVDKTNLQIEYEIGT